MPNRAFINSMFSRILLTILLAVLATSITIAFLFIRHIYVMNSSSHMITQLPTNSIFALGPPPLVIALLLALGLALIAIILGYISILRITKPLKALVQGAEVLASGDLSHRIEIAASGELEDLANALNTMAENLQQYRKELEEEHDRAVTAARESRTLYRVSQTLVSTLDLHERLRFIAENLAQVCHAEKSLIWLIEGEHIVPYESYGLSKTDESVFCNWEIHINEAMKITQRALSERRPIAIEDMNITENIPKNLASRLKIKSALALPFVFEDRPVGYAIVYESDRKHKFTEYQINLAQAIAAQAAVAIQNAIAYERERRIAETLQRSFLPSVPPSIGNFEIADRYSPAWEEAEVGGDFYDVIRLSPTKVALVIADISGKGLNAAVYTAMIKYMIMAYVAEYSDPIELMNKLNSAIYRYIGEEVFITLFFGVLDVENRELTYVNAGHELPLLFGEDRKICMTLSTTGTALGILESYQFGMDKISFVPGDVLLLYTDGATDARRGKEFLGMEGLEALFCDAAVYDAHRAIKLIDQGIREYANGVLRDDIALLVIKYAR